MTKHLLILLLLLLITAGSTAQQHEPAQAPDKVNRFFIDLSPGVSFPIGKVYPLFDTNSTKSGYASTGYIIQANLAWLGKSDWGLGLQYTFQHNPLKSGASEVVPDGTTYPLGKGGWSNNYLMVGPVYLPSFKKVILEIEGLIGIIISFSPVFNDTDPRNGMNNSNIGFGFGLGARAGVGYMITPKIAVMLNLNYLGGFPVASKEYQPQSLGYDSVTNQIIYSALTEIKIKKTVSTFNIGAGIVYKFGSAGK
ncbi:MAG TPA: hypothetical protein VMC08_10245 [Bacteroidales bacterium]|nr:hypothetical protein [Bacteroidales bacterium]